MKWRRAGPLAILTLALLAAAVWWSSRRDGHPTPAACVEAYRDALVEGDVAKYRGCLAGPLRSQARESAETLREKMKDVRGWVQHDPVVEGPVAHVDVDEVRSGVRRFRFRLEQTGGGWRIVEVGPAQEITPPVRPGTPVGQEAAGKGGG